MISMGHLNCSIANGFPCNMACRPGVSKVQSYTYLTQVLVYCPIHQVTMDITRYSLTKMYKIVQEEIVKPAIKLTFPSEVSNWQELQVHLGCCRFLCKVPTVCTALLFNRCRTVSPACLSWGFCLVSTK